MSTGGGEQGALSSDRSDRSSISGSITSGRSRPSARLSQDFSSSLKSSARSSAADEQPFPEKLSPVHEQLLHALTISESLSPIHVDVRNDSYWFAMRHRVGPRKHMAMIVKYSDSYARWDSYIFKMKLRESDMEMVPKRTAVGHAKTKWGAYKTCDAACKERDLNPAKVKKMAEIMPPEKILSTHFWLMVVSERFQHLNYTERVALVHEALVKSMGVQCVPDMGQTSADEGAVDHEGSEAMIPAPAHVGSGLGRCAPTRMKQFSGFGPKVCQLPLFRFLLPTHGTPIQLMVDARTPAQWRPEIYKPPVSERMGASHVGWRSVLMQDPAKTRSQKLRVKKLTTVVSKDPHTQQRDQLMREAQQQLQEKEEKRASSSRASSRPATSQSVHSDSGAEDGGGRHVQQPHGGDGGAKKRKRKKGEAEAQQSVKEIGRKMAESLGLDATVSGVKYRKLGGIYGHFFNDLPENVKEMVMSRYKDNKTLIQDESNHEVQEYMERKRKEQLERDFSNVPMTNLARMRMKQEHNSLAAAYDKGTATEAEMMEEVNCSHFCMERAAIRLQRMRRLKVYYRAVKLLWWRQYAALCIQRMQRGIFGRRYALLLRQLRPRAAIRIQRCFRDSKSRVLLKVWQWLSYRLTRTVLPKIKRFIRNCFLSWIEKRTAKALLIQTMVRGFLSRCRLERKRGFFYFFKNQFPSAAPKIQKIIRGFLTRQRYQRHVERVLVERIDIPAAVRLQRIYRGRLAKQLLKQLKLEYRSLLLIQHCVRQYVHRLWRNQMMLERRRKHAATAIQRIYRGRLDRELYSLKAHVRWYNTRFIPAVILTQSTIRRHQATQFVKKRRRQTAAAAVIQRTYRDFIKCRAARRLLQQLRATRKYRYAAVLQKYIRRWITGIAYRRRRREYDAQRIAAAKRITRAWSLHILNRKFHKLLDEHRRVLLHRKINKIVESRQDVAEDIEEIKRDVASTQKLWERQKERVKLIEKFEQQAGVRTVNVKNEMRELTVDDFERGWAEALGQEYETLNYQVLMAREELRLLRAQIRSRSKEMLHLHFEREEAEIEMDNIEVAELESWELLRRNELKVIDREAILKWRRSIRREKSHWRIASNRMTVILRNRVRYQEILRKARAGRDQRYATTISYERRARERDLEDLNAQKMLAEDSRKQDEENRPREYNEFGQPMMRVYDSVVGSTLDLLRGFTLDERAHRLREQYQQKEKLKKKLQKGQFAPLKAENQKGGAFSYLDESQS